MADIQVSGNRNSSGLPKMQRVDLTAMVDVGFLLITFFMLVSNYTSHKNLEMVKPIEETDPSQEITERKTLCLLLAKDNQIYSYSLATKPNEYETMKIESLSFASESLRKKLLERKEQVSKEFGDPNQLTIYIKPMDHSIYKNFVDVLDEIKIAKLTRYILTKPDQEVDQYVIGKLNL